MPTQRQSTLIDTIDITTEGLGSSDSNRLRVSYSQHVDSVVLHPLKIDKFPTGNGHETVEINLTRPAFRAAYEKYVKSGFKEIAGSYWNSEESADLSYTRAPKLGVDAPEGEQPPGGDATEIGSTIVKSGLGPNVNVHGNLSDRAVVDGSTPGSSAVLDPHHSGEGSISPDVTSKRIAAETTLPPGTHGHIISGE